MLLNQNGHVNTTPPPQASLDFNSLLSEGLAVCQTMGSDRWTDYNEHDPGVTTLEQLCYAITDLSYRAGFSMPDLLAEHPASQKPGLTSLYTGDQALSSAPLTQHDYRKVVHSKARSGGLGNFKNVWLEPTAAQGVGGLYDMLIEVYDQSEDSEPVTQACQQVFHDHRNLCEDLDKVLVLKSCGITVAASIELLPGISPESTMADILYAIQDMLVPFVRIDSLAQQLASGMPPDQVFRGPLLECGYIGDDQLAPRRQLVSTSDVGAAILTAPGVLSMSGLKIGSDNGKQDASGVHIDDQHVPRLVPSIFSVQLDFGGLALTRNGQPLAVDASIVRRLLQQKLGQLHGSVSAQASVAAAYRKLPQGRRRDVSRFVSVQHQFPDTYGIGRGGVAPTLPQASEHLQAQAVRKAQARQMKAYLLHFEQMLADCGAQLANAGRLLSLDPALEQSYFWQSLLDLPEGPPDMLELLRSAPDAGPAPAGGDRYTVQIDNAGGTGLRSRDFGDAASAGTGASDILVQGSDDSAYELRTLPAEQQPMQLWLIRDSGGNALAFGKRLYASAAEAEQDKPEIIAHLRMLAQDSAARARDMRIACHGSRSAQLVDSSGQVMLASTGLTGAEQAGWLSRLLHEGINALNYRSIQQADGRWRVALMQQDAALAESLQRYPDEPSAAQAIAETVILVQSLCCNHDVQQGHVVLQPPPAAPPDPQPGRDAYKKGMDQLVAADDPWRTRRMRFLDHLLARFNERFEDDELRQADPRCAIDPDAVEQDLIDSKVQFLSHFVDCNPDLDASEELLAYSLSGARMRGIGHRQVRSTGESIRSGLASRLQLLLAIPERGAAGPAETPELLFVVEHVLLRGLQQAPGGTGIAGSFFPNQLTVVLPSAPQRFQSPAFRALAEQLVAENCPAHLAAGCLWLDAPSMAQFIDLHAKWLKARGTSAGPQASLVLAQFIQNDGKTGGSA